MENEFKSFPRHHCLKFVTFHCNAWLDPVTNFERLWSSDLHQQMATENRRMAGLSKVDSIACRSKHKYLTSCIVCSCVIYASYARMQVFTIKSVNHKLCEITFKFTFLIFQILSVFSFKFLAWYGLFVHIILISVFLRKLNVVWNGIKMYANVSLACFFLTQTYLATEGCLNGQN
jgi:hypothetical protein